MDSVIKPLIDKITSPLLLVGLLAFGILVYSVMHFFFKATKDAWIERVKSFKPFKGKDEFTYTIKDLKSHKVFGKLERLKMHRHEFETHGKFDKLKTDAFNFFLEAKLDSTAAHLIKIVNEASNELNRMELRSLIDRGFENCNDSLKCKMYDKLTGENNPDRVSPLTANKIIEKFFNVREVAMNKYGDTFDDIFSEPTFENNYQIINVVLFVTHIESNDMINACIEAFNEVNGVFMKIENERKKRRD